MCFFKPTVGVQTCVGVNFLCFLYQTHEPDEHEMPDIQDLLTELVVFWESPGTFHTEIFMLINVVDILCN